MTHVLAFLLLNRLNVFQERHCLSAWGADLISQPEPMRQI